MRSAYEVANSMRKEVIIGKLSRVFLISGTTNVSTPNQMVDDIKNLKNAIKMPEESSIASLPEETKASNGSLGQKKESKGFKRMLKNLKIK